MVSGKMSPNENMATDEAILNGVMAGSSDPTIRFYDWDPPTASFGFHQKIESEIDYSLLENKGWGVVRRPTGGRLVLHIDEVTYAVIGPMEGYLNGNLTESYSAISLALAEGFKGLGIDVDFEKGSLSAAHQRKESNPCFSSSSRYELNYQRKKIVGSAQVRKQHALLQHGSILLNHDQGKVVEILPGLDEEQREKLRKYLSKKTISINQILEEKIDFSKAVKSFSKGFIKAWGKDEFFFQNQMTSQEKEEVRELIKYKYSKENWNQRK